jgi:N-methylhydantoinase A
MYGADAVDGRPRLGVDVGGTFTDLVAVVDGRLAVEKVASTPNAPERAVLDAVRSGRIDPTVVGFFAHGTTVATNAVLEGEWADTALVTTAGFRDALEIGRQDRPSLYDLHAEKPRPVVERDRRFEVTERLDERGTVLEPLDESSVDRVAERLADVGVESVAVSLLFAYENPVHEERVVARLREALDPEPSISRSSAVMPEVREYERTLVTCLNAALRPVVDTYVGALDRSLEDAGLDTSLRLMGSNAGLMSATAARERPVHTLLSGPAAGVRGATHVAGRAGHDDLLTMDMGGTSCDVSLVREGDPAVSTDVEVGDYPVGVPMVDVHTVGAGGGSIARVDAGGALRVGPASAGADPGPVCYGRGGTEPTVTDANFVLGRIDPEAFLGDVGGAGEAAHDAVADLADEMGTTTREAAAGVLDVANANMARALRVVSVERGHDPRAFTLVAFGGAGPLHASALAAEVGVPRVLVPRAAGVLSALGLLVSDLTYDESVSRVRPFGAVDTEALSETLADLERQGRARLDETDVDEVRVERSLDVRYRGQSFDLSVPVADGGPNLDALAGRFHETHERRYGSASPGEPLELVTVRVRVRGVVDPPELTVPDRGGAVADARRETRPVWFDGETPTPVYERAALPICARVDGPAVVEGSESTLVVRPDDTVTVDTDGNLLVEVER